MTRNNYQSKSALEDLGWVDALSLYADSPWVRKDALVDTEILLKYDDVTIGFPETFR